MIYIINYDLRKRKNLYEKLEKLGVEFKIGLNENEILKAEKIILPETEDLFKALRKIHFSNLHSVLRMFKGAVLGFGNGFLLMLNKCEQKPCFGFFPYNAKFSEKKKYWDIYDESGNIRSDAIYQNGRFFGVLLMEEKNIDEALNKFLDFNKK